MVCEGLAGCPPPTQLAVCQLRHRQDLSLSALCALACSYTASAVQIALPHMLTSNRLSIKEQRAKELKKPQSQNKKKKE